jgi:hypothetical protein
MSSTDASSSTSVQTPEPGTIDMKLEVVTLPVTDVDRAKRFHLAGGRVPGPDPEGRSYQTYAAFSDPDGNGRLLQEIKTRLPGREWKD